MDVIRLQRFSQLYRQDLHDPTVQYRKEPCVFQSLLLFLESSFGWLCL